MGSSSWKAHKSQGEWEGKHPACTAGWEESWGYQKVGTAQVRLSLRDPGVGSPGQGRSWEFPGLDELAPKPLIPGPGLDPGHPASEGTWDQERGTVSAPGK